MACEEWSLPLCSLALSTCHTGRHHLKCQKGWRHLKKRDLFSGITTTKLVRDYLEWLLFSGEEDALRYRANFRDNLLLPGGLADTKWEQKNAWLSSRLQRSAEVTTGIKKVHLRVSRNRRPLALQRKWNNSNRKRCPQWMCVMSYIYSVLQFLDLQCSFTTTFPWWKSSRVLSLLTVSPDAYLQGKGLKKATRNASQLFVLVNLINCFLPKKAALRCISYFKFVRVKRSDSAWKIAWNKERGGGGEMEGEVWAAQQKNKQGKGRVGGGGQEQH